MGSERLAQLTRQKDLLTEHLDWLNQEIDREVASCLPSKTPKTSRLLETYPADRPVAERLDLETRSASMVASDLYEELGPDTGSTVAATKRGCLILSAVAFLSVLGLFSYVFFWY